MQLGAEEGRPSAALLDEPLLPQVTDEETEAARQRGLPGWRWGPLCLGKGMSEGGGQGHPGSIR